MENKIDMGEKLDSIGRKILAAARNELYLKDAVHGCSAFEPNLCPGRGACGMGTDGLYLYYHPQYLGGFVPGGPGHGEPDLPTSGASWHIPPYDPAKGQGGRNDTAWPAIS